MLNLYQEANEDSAPDRHIQIEYFDGMDKEQSESTLNRLLEDFSYKGSFEETINDDFYISYGEVHAELNGKDTKLTNSQTNKANRFFALIETKDSKQVVTITYMLLCQESSSCDIKSEEEQNFMKQVYESITFK
ncbi:hypothetical protein [Bacillus sp. JCM 19041]|uniref:hypothetical protein n=1 Tax=Bacillus sp. JCM 19041 TaxID=1460637 RepID=UPI0012E20572